MTDINLSMPISEETKAISPPDGVSASVPTPTEMFQPDRVLGNTLIPVGAGEELSGVGPLAGSEQEVWGTSSGGLIALVPVSPTVLPSFDHQNPSDAESVQPEAAIEAEIEEELIIEDFTIDGICGVY